MITLADWISLIANLVVLAFGMKLILEIFRSRNVPPFIRTRESVAQEAAEAFGQLAAGSVVYDPGCGDGRVLFAIAARNPGARCVGIELRIFPYLRALLLKRKHPDANILLVRGNAFRQDLSEATHLYTYLYPEVMDRLLPKLQKEVRPGTILISLDFPFTDKEAEKTIPLASAEEGKLGRMLHVYRF